MSEADGDDLNRRNVERRCDGGRGLFEKAVPKITCRSRRVDISAGAAYSQDHDAAGLAAGACAIRAIAFHVEGPSLQVVDKDVVRPQLVPSVRAL
jgi:hypothetical protein